MNQNNILKWLDDGILDRNLATTATTKNHKHIHGKIFKSISHCSLTPAQYRHSHAKMVNGKLVRMKVKK